MAEDIKKPVIPIGLEEFRLIIEDMLGVERVQHSKPKAAWRNNDIGDTSPSFKTVEDDGANQLTKEEAGQLAQRQYKFIQDLQAALVHREQDLWRMPCYRAAYSWVSALYPTQHLR